MPKFRIILATALVLGGCSAPEPKGEVAANQLRPVKDAWWEFFQRENPENATSLGEYKYNDRLSDVSVDHVPQVRSEASALLARVEAIDPKALSPADQLDQSLLSRTLTEQITGLDLKTWEMPVDQFNGLQIALPQIATFAPFDTVKHYEDYIARLRQVPVTLAQATAVMRIGMQDGIIPPATLLEKTIPQCGIIAQAAGLENPFALPAKKFPDTFSPEDKERLRKTMIAVVDDQIRPAYKTLQNFIRAEYAPKGRREPGIWSVPGGPAIYLAAVRQRTTTAKSPQEIHEIGLAQVSEIEAQLDALGRQAGYPDGKTFRRKALSSPKYKTKSRDEILDRYRRYISEMEPKLPQLFGRLPRARLVVASVPEFMEKDGSTQYIQGPPDGSRPGQVWVVTYDPSHHTILEDEATAYHEGIPGHHMQNAIANELSNQHPFRRAMFFGAFAEGWALYSERLGKELGFYREPASELGRLQSEMFRACRLVVDTGVHYKHWTRKQMTDFFTEHYGDPQDTEVDRYIVWPAQALSYKMGQLSILDLRQRAQKAMGSKFNIKAFHDEILGAGALPLDLLAARIDTWIASGK